MGPTDYPSIDLSPSPRYSSQAPVLSLYALGSLETTIVKGEAYQSPVYTHTYDSKGGSTRHLTGYETLYYEDKSYYLIEEDISDISLFSVSATDADTPQSGLYFYETSNPPMPGENDTRNNFELNDGVLSLVSPFVYSEQGDSSNRYSVIVTVRDDGPGYAGNSDSETIHFQVTEVTNVLQYGDAGNNSFDGFSTGYTGIDGGDGVDTVNYDMESENASFTLNSNNPYLKIKSQTNSDKLSNIERLYFTDKAYALDLDGNAGIAAKVIIATFGASDLSTYMKAGLDIVDNGTTLDELCDLVISGKYIESSAGGSDMGTFVEYVYGNVVGRELNAFEAAMMDHISTGGFTKAALLKLAVQTDDVASQITTNAIDLIGVAGSSDGEKLVISYDV
jgi:hypothetical protein